MGSDNDAQPTAQHSEETDAQEAIHGDVMSDDVKLMKVSDVMVTGEINPCDVKWAGPELNCSLI